MDIILLKLYLQVFSKYSKHLLIKCQFSIKNIREEIMVRRLRKKDFFRGKKEPVKVQPVIQETEEKVIIQPQEELIEKPKYIKPKVIEKAKDKPKNIKEFYEKKYKILMIIPIILLIGALLQITFQTINTGDFVKKGISLSGGVSFSATIENEIDIIELETNIQNSYPDNEINVRELTDSKGKMNGFIIEADIDGTDTEAVNNFVEIVTGHHQIPNKDYTLEVMGSSLGKSFFTETLRILFVAFLAMAMVVFLLFGEGFKFKTISAILTVFASIFIMFFNSRTLDIIAYIIGLYLIYLYFSKSLPSIAVIQAAFSDIFITLAIFNLLGFKLSTSGVAAFLMLIGYSVDSDILLSTKVLKTKQGNVMSRIYEAMKTGLMMSFTTIIAITIGLIFSQSEVISQIMVILLIGLLVDLLFTWILNVGLLRIYLNE